MGRNKLFVILAGIAIAATRINDHTHRIVVTDNRESKVKLSPASKKAKGKKSTYQKQMKQQPQSVKKDFNQRRR